MNQALPFTIRQGADMAEDVSKQKWLAISFFLVCNLIFFALIYAIITGSTDSANTNWMGSTRVNPGRNSQAAGISKEGWIVLVKDQPVSLAKVRMTYRGLSSGLLRLDLVLPDLDPQYVYHRQIPVKEAQQGFQVSSQRFRVISLNRRRLHLIPIKPSL